MAIAGAPVKNNSIGGEWWSVASSCTLHSRGGEKRSNVMLNEVICT